MTERKRTDKSEPKRDGRDGRGRFVKGAAPKSPGRPKEYRAFKERARALMDERGFDVLASLLAEDGDDRRFALKLLTEYAYGKPALDVNVAATVAVAYAAEDLDLLG